ncbi:Gfo/Idh/MocA family protein [Paenibacillus xerothermodurans]|uniref:Gfo/Idh/MocA family oxidoreductase n=1 Tax=Paenibacillus xerothermodurans TaxID=1977292 RepID=A0A2W1NM54_PAEXE|nr:Gfo/Idh/MocA family oxidoreductase [Paenibacillus xerothermodurans]PZE20535.1 gfo/Idh/MocA family oxidoreductase [Paenibacillus xerothermodurans]
MVVRVGVVGAGGIGAEHLKHLHNNEYAELAAVCDIVQANAERAAAEFGAAAYSDFDEMLAKEQLDALFLCVPPFAHGHMEEKAAERGIHLFVEKPVGLDMETVERKRSAIESANIMVSTGYCLRHLDTIARAKQYLRDKKIAMVRAHRFGSFLPVPWWRDITKSGGQLVEQTTHNVDLMRYLAGDVTKVSADMALTVMDDVPGITIPDVYSVNLLFASGAVGHLDTSFVDQPDGRSSLEVIGRGFRVFLEGTALTIMENNHTVTYKNQVNVYKAQDDAFIQAVMSGNPDSILAPYQEAVETLKVTLSAHDSAKSGSSVFL